MDANDPYPQDADSESPATPEKESEGVEETTLLPKSFFGGDVEPGHRCEIEVVACHEDECEVKYVKPEAKESSTDEANMALDKMATEKEE